MVHRTTVDEKLPRSELAAYPTALTEEFNQGDEEVHVDIGNETIPLTPAEDVDFSVDVIERSSLLQGRRETIEIELSRRH